MAVVLDFVTPQFDKQKPRLVSRPFEEFIVECLHRQSFSSDFEKEQAFVTYGHVSADIPSKIVILPEGIEDCD